MCQPGSLLTITFYLPATSKGLFLASSLMTSCTTYRSWLPTSLGFNSTW